MDDFLVWLKAEKDRVAGWALIALGAVAIFIGYQGVADSPYVAEQLAYIASGAVGGLFLLGVGATLLITADIRDEWRKLDRIDRSLNDGVDVRAILTKEPAPKGAGEPREGASETSASVASRASVARTEDVASKATGPPWPERGGSGNGSDRATAGAVKMSAGGAAAIDRGQTITAATMMVGLVPIAIGWWIAGDTSDPQQAVRALSGGVTGLLVAAAAAGAGILWMRRSVFVRRNRVFGAWFLHDAAAELGSGRASGVSAAAGSGDVLIAGGLTRYHTQGCPALAGVAGVRRRSIDKVGNLEPCGLCQGS